MGVCQASSSAQLGYLFVTFLFGFLGEIKIFAAGLAFPGKGGLQILTGFAHNSHPNGH
jgi:hypothetical protein